MTSNVVAGQMRLVVHARHFQHAVRVAGEQRPPGRGLLRAERPVVAAAGDFRLLLVVAGQQCCESRLEVGERGEITHAFSAGRNAQHVVAAVVEPQFCDLVGADDRQCGRAPQFPPHRAHQEADLAHHRDGMPRLPLRGSRAEDGVFRWPSAERDEGVDAARIGFEHGPGVVVEQREIAPRGAGGVELPPQHICGDGGLADPLCIAPGATPQQRFHLPETVLRVRKSEPGKGIEMRGSADMWNAPSIASQLYRSGQTGHRRRARKIRQTIPRTQIDRTRCHDAIRLKVATSRVGAFELGRRPFATAAGIPIAEYIIYSGRSFRRSQCMSSGRSTRHAAATACPTDQRGCGRLFSLARLARRSQTPSGIKTRRPAAPGAWCRRHLP